MSDVNEQKTQEIQNLLPKYKILDVIDGEYLRDCSYTNIADIELLIALCELYNRYEPGRFELVEITDEKI